MAITYKDAGVDIAAGEETVDRIKPLVRSTFNSKVLTDIGLFGGFYDADFSEYKKPILVASTDGVGTKLKMAFATGKHNTIGQCLVNHCTDDILACGAKPLFFLDYFAVGKLDPGVAEQVISGFAIACKENGAALIGGETAEMPSMYNEGEYDVSGTIVGIVDKEKIVDGKKIAKGDVMIGIPSTGLHTNGYSLARKVLLSKYKHDQYVDEISNTVADALLAIHRSYLNSVLPLVDAGLLKGISHVTGGGIVGNTSRIIPEGLTMNINWNSWNVLPIFNLIQKTGDISDEEMRKAFNLGIGMILVVSKDNTDKVLDMLKDDKALVIGDIG
ncbi:MAG: phosphoribosylformylglycinamidine cyclo-ligase, partial [Candidatus Kapabacteria bacterium]|nr:phosphoribosylformylglycinamidine cyclo-ligase [Candidatus Kapabacteria bacterium]